VHPPARQRVTRAVVVLYSIIHLETGELPRAFEEIRRVLRPSGLALVAFHIGSEVRHLDQWWGVEVDVDFRFLEMPNVAEIARRAGFGVEAQIERASYPGEAETRRGYLLARRHN
jgi:hypothetical protein